MEQITIHVKNKQKAQALISFLKNLDFIDEVTAKKTATSTTVQTNEADFFALAGLWAERDINLDAIRLKAWRQQL